MKAAFDDSAALYDEHFTNTTIGRLQRNKVWNYLEKTFKSASIKKVLELNCGTGEDAVFFAQHNIQLLATDISKKMLEQTQLKIEQFRLSHLAQTKRLDISAISTTIFQEKYDLIFSNFGGLNCISIHQIESLLNKATEILTPKGRIILVIMPKFCAWETIFYSSKLNFTNAFRRQKQNKQKASIENNEVEVWYHSPKELSKLGNKYYDIINTQPVGITIPPSYLQKTFISKSRILNKLEALENKLNRFSFLASMADHYLIDLQLK